MQENEVKILEVKRPEIEERLLKMGARKVFEGELDAIIFDTDNGDLKKNQKLLRLRKQGDKTFITFKIRISDPFVKSAQEIETEIGDFETMRVILGKLGYVEKHSMKKTRISYSLGDIHIEFDKYHGIYEKVPEFLEIESEDIEKIHTLAKRLGFSDKDCLPWTSADVTRHYKIDG